MSSQKVTNSNINYWIHYQVTLIKYKSKIWIQLLFFIFTFLSINYSGFAGPPGDSLKKHATQPINKTNSFQTLSTPSVAGSVTDNKCFGANWGEIKYSFTGGKLPYNYSWSNGKSGKLLAPKWQLINIVNDDIDLYNYQILVSVDFVNGMQPDYSDLIFTDTSNTTSYSFWISEIFSDWVDIWVKVPFIPNGDSEMRMWFGNPLPASLSNAQNTFEYFDDFEDGDASDWTKVTNNDDLPANKDTCILSVAPDPDDHGNATNALLLYGYNECASNAYPYKQSNVLSNAAKKNITLPAGQYAVDIFNTSTASLRTYCNDTATTKAIVSIENNIILTKEMVFEGFPDNYCGGVGSSWRTSNSSGFTSNGTPLELKVEGQYSVCDEGYAMFDNIRVRKYADIEPWTYVIDTDSNLYLYDLKAGDYTVNVTDDLGTTFSNTFTVIQPVPPASAGASRCGNGSVTLSPAGPYTSYRWYNAATGGSAISTSTNYNTPSLSSSRNYYLVGVGSDGCWSTPRQAVVATVFPLPAASATSPSSFSRCGTGSVTLQANVSPSTYRWYNVATGGSSLLTGDSYSTPSISSNTTYYASTVNSNGCESSGRVAINANVNPLPSPPSPAASAVSRCGPGTLTLQATGSPSKYIWYDASMGGNSLDTNDTYITPTISNNSIYYVSSLDNNNCESNTRNTVNAIINPLPAMPTAPSVPRCGPGSVTLSASGSPQSYNWYNVDNGGTSLGTSNTFDVQNIIKDSILYVSSVDGNGCESPLTLVTAIINPFPSAPIAETVSRCGPGTLTLKASGSPSTYNWYSVSSGGTSLGTSNNFITPPINKDSIFYVSAVDGNECESSVTPVNVIIDKIPQGILSGNDTILINQTPKQLTVSGKTGNILEWQQADDLLFSNPVSFAVTDTFFNVSGINKSAFYKVKIQSGSCPVHLTNPIEIRVNLPQVCKPDSVVLFQNEVITSGRSVLLNDTDPNVDQLKILPILNYTTTKGGIISIYPDGRYDYYPPSKYSSWDTVYFEVCDDYEKNVQHCKQTYLYITIKHPLMIYQSLSPNGDNLNDEWIIAGIENFPNNQVSIFNRWGELIFETKNYNNNEKIWKGNNAFNKSNLPEGTYFYKVDLNDGSDLKTGFVELKR